MQNKQKQKITSIGKTVEKLEAFYIAGSNAMENSLWFLKKLNRMTIWSSSSTQCYVAKGTENQDSNTYLYISVHCSATCSRQKAEIT